MDGNRPSALLFKFVSLLENERTPNTFYGKHFGMYFGKLGDSLLPWNRKFEQEKQKKSNLSLNRGLIDLTAKYR